jgi:hypothetical protein
MKKLSGMILVLAICLLPFALQAQNKYVGNKSCMPCHKGAAKGAQAETWEKSKHAGAYNTLLSPKALEIAKGKGLANAADAKECLECHSLGKTVDAALLDSKFDIKAGVQCETCHGAGSAYKPAPIMKDKAKAIEAGLVAYADEAAIEKQCRSCHNEKSPTFKSFDFKTMYEKVKHNKPK